jgi:hypothetical protein
MLSDVTTGALHELIVAADLIKRGFHVLRALSPHGPFDLYAYRESRGFRIEVRTVPASRLTGFPTPRKRPTDECDVYAWVTRPHDSIVYTNAADDRLWDFDL